MAAAIEIRHVSKYFRLYHEHYTSLKERMIHFGRIPFEDFVALNDIDIDIEDGHDRRDPRPQRLGQVDAAEVRRRDPAAERGRDRHPGPAGRAARARRGLPPRADRARERLHERVDPRPLEARHHRGLRRDRRVRRARQVHRHAGAPLLVGHVRPARLRGRRQRRPRHPPRRRGARRSATRRSSASASSGSREFQREGRTILFVTHAADLVRRGLRAGHRARPRRARRRRAAGRGGPDLPRDAAALRPRRSRPSRRSRPPTRPQPRTRTNRASTSRTGAGWRPPRRTG